MLGVEVGAPVPHRRVKDLRPRQAVAGFRCQRLADRRRDLRGARAHLVRFRLVGLLELLEQREEAHPRTSIPVAWREVGAAEERLSRRRQPHRHRPAATPLVEHLNGAHVDGVDVGPLLAVDLDDHVVLVQERRDLLVFEGLAFHHVTPVAGRVADGQEDGPAEPLRGLEGLVPPRVPVDRVVGVLPEVGARLEEQAVRVDRCAVVVQVMRARLVALWSASPRLTEPGSQLGGVRLRSRQRVLGELRHRGRRLASDHQQRRNQHEGAPFHRGRGGRHGR